MLYFKAQKKSSNTDYKKNHLLYSIGIVLFVFTLILIPIDWIKLLFVLLFPLELRFLELYAVKIYPKLLSFKTDHLETSKSICNVDLVVTDMRNLIDYEKANITHFETLDLTVNLNESSLPSDLSRKNLTKLMQTALLCTPDDGRLLPRRSQISTYFPIDETYLEDQWPKLRAWQKEGLWFTQHQESKTQMTQLMCMGDLDKLLERCTHVLTQGGIDILKKEHVAKLIASEHKHGHNLERMWGYAFKIDSKNNISDEVASDLIYIGAISIFAPVKLAPLEKENLVMDLHHSRFKVITLSQESPIYVTAVARHLNLINEEHRVLDQDKLLTYSNQTLLPVLDRYAFFTRFDDDQLHRLIALYRKKNHVILKTLTPAGPLTQLDDSLFDYEVNQACDVNLLMKAFDESSNLIIRFRKLKTFVIAMHLAELLSLPLMKLTSSMITISPYWILLLNLTTASLLGIALFIETVDPLAPKSTNAGILKNGGVIGLYCLMIALSNYNPLWVPFVGLTFVGMAFMIQNPISISLRQIAFKKTPLNAASGVLIFIFIVIISWEMKSHFDLNSLTKLVMTALTPMILHDLVKLGHTFIQTFSKQLNIKR